MLDVARRRWSREMLDAVGDRRGRCCRRVRVAGRLRARLARGGRRSPASPKARRSSPARAIRRPAPSAWASRGPAPSARRSARPASCSRRPIGPALDPQGRLHTFCHAIPGRWHVMGVTQAAGLSLRWFRDQLARRRRSASYDQLTAEAARVAARRRRRALGAVPDGRAHAASAIRTCARALVGLAASHGRGHIVRAVLEGVAFSLRDTFTIFAELRRAGRARPARRRRRAVAALAPDPGRRLRPRRSRRSRPTKARRTARRSWPASASASGRRWTRPATLVVRGGDVDAADAGGGRRAMNDRYRAYTGARLSCAAESEIHV